MPDWTTVSHPPARTSPWATLSVAHAAGTVNDSGKVLEGFSGHGLAALEATLDSIGAARYVSLGELAIAAWSSAEPLPFAQRREGEQRALRVGDKWGGLFDCAWMRFTGTVPPAAAGDGSSVAGTTSAASEALAPADAPSAASTSQPL